MLTFANFHIEGGSVAFLRLTGMTEAVSAYEKISKMMATWNIPWSMGKILHQLTFSLIKINHRFIIKLTLSILMIPILSIKTF